MSATDGVPTLTGSEDRFAANMRSTREAQGWNQSEFARRLVAAGLDNFHQTTVSRIEQGQRPVRLTEAIVIAEVLGVPVDQLAGASDVLPAFTRIKMALQKLETAQGALVFAAQEYDTRMKELRAAIGADGSTGWNTIGHRSPWVDERVGTAGPHSLVYEGFGAGMDPAIVEALKMLRTRDAERIHEHLDSGPEQVVQQRDSLPPF